MTPELDANQRFIYRAAGSTDATLLAHATPVERDELVLAIPDAQRKDATGAVVLPAGKAVALGDLLATVKSQFVGQGLGFPHLIMPPPAGPADALQDVRDYCLVYDFVRQARALSVITRIDRIEDISGIRLSPAQGSELSPELRDEFVGEVSAGGYFTADFWEALLTDGADRQKVELVRARVGGEDAGLAVIVPGTAEFRLLALFTRGKLRGRGVGRLLAGRFIRTAQKASAPLVSTSYPAEGACEFYLAKYGFEPALQWVVQRPPSPDFFAPG